MTNYRIIEANNRFEIEKFNPDTNQWEYMADRFTKMLANSYISIAKKLESKS